MPPKGYKTRKTCIVEGCPNPPLVYGDGRASLPCCAEHAARHRGVVTRNGVRLTGALLDMMRRLRDALRTENPFVELLSSEHRTAKALRRRDWVFIGNFEGKLRCKLTGRGEDALHFFDLPTLRGKGGKCPSCRARDRVVEGGMTQVFCAECAERFIHAIGEPKTCAVRDGICTIEGCGKRRHRHRSGRINNYCLEHMRTERTRRATAQLERIRNGAPIPICPRCTTQPVRVCPDSVSSYCPECERLVRLERKIKRLKLKQES